ncbi:hypothetical protein [Couchioplanes caeruleus]|uniref:Uncharacterized protein n=1 Tax=Couchioplanes caeruleus subsp. caeruleus TaxID=56427 RepID=A0A1K0FIV9_9ACTN|nr:hypothetical protein [Couchioplanes caeruleus]OJF12773.1 hypothetical protein BG844_18770 [Couchioplanes caeruleus subsp. caeruleus]
MEGIDVRQGDDAHTLILVAASVHVMLIRLRYDGGFLACSFARSASFRGPEAARQPAAATHD